MRKEITKLDYTPPPPPQSISQVEELRENKGLTPLHSDCCHAEQQPLM